jgi:NAD(P)H-hydrate epimerase
MDYEISVDILQTLSAKNAAALDKDLMSIGAFSIDQLMELAGLSVSQAGLRSFPSNILHFLKI